MLAQKCFSFHMVFFFYVMLSYLETKIKKSLNGKLFGVQGVWLVCMFVFTMPQMFYVNNTAFSIY